MQPQPLGLFSLVVDGRAGDTDIASKPSVKSILHGIMEVCMGITVTKRRVIILAWRGCLGKG